MRDFRFYQTYKLMICHFLDPLCFMLDDLYRLMSNKICSSFKVINFQTLKLKMKNRNRNISTLIFNGNLKSILFRKQLGEMA